MAGETNQNPAAQGAHTEVPAEQSHGGDFPPFNPSLFPSQILWLIITFAVFYWIMKHVSMPRIGGILEDRRDRIAGDLAEADRLKQETDQAIADYEQAIAEARAKAQGIAQQTRDKLKAEDDARRAGVEADLAKKLEEADARISSIRSEAMAQVGDIAEETSSALVEALIGKAPTKAELNKALKQALS